MSINAGKPLGGGPSPPAQSPPSPCGRRRRDEVRHIKFFGFLPQVGDRVTRLQKCELHFTSAAPAPGEWHVLGGRCVLERAGLGKDHKTKSTPRPQEHAKKV